MAGRAVNWALRSWGGRATCGGLIALHQFDTHYRYNRFNRCLRSVGAACLTLYDFKVNLMYATDLDELHERVAKRWYDVCCTNAGLYIKIGQQIATMNHVLPAPYLKYFSTLHDQAPSVDFATVERIVRSEFEGKGPHELFVDFETEPVAAASIAQVHRASLPDGTKVAVKVQKPEIQHQMPWDLLCFRLLVFGFEKAFDLPMYFCVDGLCEAVRQEADFRTEAKNAQLARRDLNPDPRFYVPAVHTSCSSKKVLTMEWIDGIKISDLTALQAAGLSSHTAAQLMVDLFSHQIFVSGFVHADPHPGNLLIRRRPASSSEGRRWINTSSVPQQLVLLDHGSYLSESESFRQEYCALWRAMVVLDTPAVDAICRAWGVADSHFFASLQLLKPFTPEKHSVHLQATTKEEVMRMHTEAYARIKQLLSDTQRVPPELILLGRNMNIVRANNKGMGSPVNRINTMAYYAVHGLRLRHDLPPPPPPTGSGAAARAPDDDAAPLSSSSSPACDSSPVDDRHAWYLDRIAHQPAHAAVDIFGNRHITPARRPGAEQPAAAETAHKVGTRAPARLSIKVPSGGWAGEWGSVVFDLDFLQLRTQLLLISLVYYSTQLWRTVNAVVLGRRVAGFEELLEHSINQTLEAKLGFRLNFDEGVNKCFG